MMSVTSGPVIVGSKTLRPRRYSWGVSIFGKTTCPTRSEKLAVVVGQMHLADGREDVAVRTEPLSVGAVGRDDEAWTSSPVVARR